MKFKKDILHKKVKIKATGEIAYIVWYDEHPEHDSFLLDLAEKEELPHFYKFDDFIFLEEQTISNFLPYRGTLPHTHHGYEYNENDTAKGYANLTTEEKKMIDRVIKIWQYNNR